jgi:hypothetical protein
MPAGFARTKTRWVWALFLLRNGLCLLLKVFAQAVLRMMLLCERLL